MEIKKFYTNNRNLVLKEQLRTVLKKINLIKLQSCSEEVYKIIEHYQKIGLFFSKKFKQIMELSENEIDYLVIHFRVYRNMLEKISSSDLRNTSSEITILLEEFFEKINMQPCFLVNPIWDFNYNISYLFHPALLEKYHEDLHQEFVEKKMQIINFGYSNLHKENLLLVGIIPHEFGHYMDLFYKLEITEKIMAKFQIDNKLQEIFYEEIYCNGKKLPSDEINKEKISKIFILECKVLNNLICEIVADTIGVLISGMAGYFAQEYLNLYYCPIGSLKNRSETHPTGELRNYFMVKELKKMGIQELETKEIVESINKFENSWKNSKDCQPENMMIKHILVEGYSLPIDVRFMKKLEEYLTNNSDLILDIIEKEFKEKYGNLIYDNKKNESDEIYLATLLKNLIPPNELENGEPSGYMTILNAGWRRFLEIASKEELDGNKELEELNKLLMKGIEASKIHKEWKNANN